MVLDRNIMYMLPCYMITLAINTAVFKKQKIKVNFIFSCTDIHAHTKSTPLMDKAYLSDHTPPSHSSP